MHDSAEHKANEMRKDALTEIAPEELVARNNATNWLLEQLEQQEAKPHGYQLPPKKK
jgi:hypothetical protein